MLINKFYIKCYLHIINSERVITLITRLWL